MLKLAAKFPPYSENDWETNRSYALPNNRCGRWSTLHNHSASLWKITGHRSMYLKRQT